MANMVRIVPFNAPAIGELPDGLLDYDFKYDLQYNQGINLIKTRYDLWNILRFSIDSLRAYFDGEVMFDVVCQSATESDKATLSMLEAVLNDRLRESYKSSMMAMCRFLRSKDIAFDESSFQPISRA